jgi:hypothetical protein
MELLTSYQYPCIRADKEQPNGRSEGHRQLKRISAA